MVANPEAFLTTATTRLAINVLQSAWKRRETYIGPWLPEPVVGAERIAKFLKAISTWFWDGVEIRWATTNGQTSAVLVRDGSVYGLITVGATADGIDQVLWMVNPEKNRAVAD